LAIIHGRDRFPREASISGCTVLTTKYGAAKNDIDIPINSWYKFDDLEELSYKVNSILLDHQKHSVAQDSYRDIINQQKNIFRIETENLLKIAWNIYNGK
jgi:hypothetical protein